MTLSPEQRKAASVGGDPAGPLLLAPDNFTPRTRTPWAGTQIHTRYKASYSPETHIGESWEVSCDPEFPSRVIAESASGVSGENQTLQDLIDKNPHAMISPELTGQAISEGSKPTCSILVKLVNAASPLSLQVHPDDHDPNLKPNECGKPESWLVLNASPDAGIYIGFKKPWSRDSLRDALAGGRISKDDLLFVPVRENDYFELGAGIVHAIGPGITLLEPQRILHGKSGKTYRLWDWNRRYDARGHEDPLAGKPRELHLDQALRCFDPSLQHGTAFAESVIRRPVRSHPASGVSVATWPANPDYQVHRITMLAESTCRVSPQRGQGYACLTVFSGSLDCGNVRVAVGRSAFLPWSALPCTFKSSIGSDFALVIHAALDVSFSV
ncbi:MAG: hypothetical protein RIQ81_1058 [Pseudomonadota bacterium]|jgi:mannose-6-phosphate isomerase